MLTEQTLFGIEDKVETAIGRLKAFEPPEGYWLAFSGGKDSQCVYHLAKMAGVKFEAHYNVTSVDPPELVRFLKKHYPDVAFDIPKDNSGHAITMWNLIKSKGILPSRVARFCCAELKEGQSGKNRLVVTGVRWAESARRKNDHGMVDLGKGKKAAKIGDELGAPYQTTDKGYIILNTDNDESRRMVELCIRTSRRLLNPIIDWTEEDVWEFLNDVAKVPHCSLYDEGLTRLGCIGCPLAGREKQRNDFKRWPNYRQAYINAIKRLLEKTGKPFRLHNDERSTSPEEILNDWIGSAPEAENAQK